MISKSSNRILSGLSVILFIVPHVFGQANFISRRDGNWSYKATWTLVSGADTDSIPDADDNVTIKSSHDVTVNVNAACNDLTINNGVQIYVGATVMLEAGKSLTVNGTLTWGYDATHPGYLQSLDGSIVTLKGPILTTSGTRLIAGHGTVVLNGSASQALSLPTTSDNSFYNLTISNASGVTFLSDATVKGTLTLSSGNVDMSTKTLRIDTTGGVSRASGHVIGNLQKYADTGNTSLTFQIGDASNYTPVDVLFGSVTSVGYLTARTTAGDHPNVSSSGIDATKSVNRYYTLTNSGVTFNNYSATFNFVAGDVDEGASTANFVVKKYSSGSWSSPAMGAVTTTSAQVNGVTSFSDFAIGEAAVLASLKIFLQGPFSGGSMTTTLNTSGLIPTTDPYTGTETVGSIPAGVVDWVQVQLRSNTTTTVATRAAFVKSDGSVVDKDGTSAVSFTGVSPGSYYIVVRHRNHLAIMSASTVALSSLITLYDFTTSQSQAYGTSPMKSVGSSFAMISGDADANSGVGASDLVSVRGAIGSTTYNASDVDMNAGGGASDLVVVRSNVGQSTQVP